MNALGGRRVLVTRPAAQSQRLESLLREQGAEPIPLPLFEIRPLGDTSEQRRVLQTAREWEGWLFTSANAARLVADLDTESWPPLYAIGQATADALASRGHPGARLSSSGNTSEALLGHPDLQQVGGQRFLICTGVGGRDALGAGLKARGARVQRLELYQRVTLDHTPDDVANALTSADSLICTSGDSVERLHALTPEEFRPALHARLLVVPSPRVIELARRLGFVSIRAPASISDPALVDCLHA